MSSEIAIDFYMSTSVSMHLFCYDIGHMFYIIEIEAVKAEVKFTSMTIFMPAATAPVNISDFYLNVSRRRQFYICDLTCT